MLGNDIQQLAISVAALALVYLVPATAAASPLLLQVDRHEVNEGEVVVASVIADSACADMAFRIGGGNVVGDLDPWRQHDSGSQIMSGTIRLTVPGTSPITAICGGPNPSESNSALIKVRRQAASKLVFATLDAKAGSAEPGTFRASLTAVLSTPAAFTWDFGDDTQLDVTPEQLVEDRGSWVHYAVHVYDKPATVKILPINWKPTPSSKLKARVSAPRAGRSGQGGMPEHVAVLSLVAMAVTSIGALGLILHLRKESAKDKA